MTLWPITRLSQTDCYGLKDKTFVICKRRQRLLICLPNSIVSLLQIVNLQNRIRGLHFRPIRYKIRKSFDFGLLLWANQIRLKDHPKKEFSSSLVNPSQICLLNRFNLNLPRKEFNIVFNESNNPEKNRLNIPRIA